MTTFLRLLSDKDKQFALASSVRSGAKNVFEVDPASFCQIPGAPFSYWISEAVRGIYKKLPVFENTERTVKQGLATADDFRFVRAWWEIPSDNKRWPGFAKGGAHSPFYADIHLVVNWAMDGIEIKNNLNASGGIRSNVWMLGETSVNYFRRPGLTWPLRARRFAPQFMPADCIFSVRGYAAFPEKGNELLTLAIFNSTAFDYLFKAALGRFGYPEFIVGILQQLPWNSPNKGISEELSIYAHRSWSLKRNLDTVDEHSHAFLLPTALRSRLSEYNTQSIEVELKSIQTKIDEIVFDLYEFSDADRIAAVGGDASSELDEVSREMLDDEQEEDCSESVDITVGLLSWAIGVAFGRFDWRLASGERAAPPEPKPFDPLLTKSPGMLPDEAIPFHSHAGILVDDPGHPHDLVHLVEEALVRVTASVPDDVRNWLQKDFFAFHLKWYSKSRRKAPVYWPLSTMSGSYTLWIYYPSLNNQTLFKAINDFLDGPNGKLTRVSRECAELRAKGSGRSKDEEKQYELLQTFEQELTELRYTLLKIAPTYQPNHVDGVQLTAAPLWPLFRHKPWQKVLKDTWSKLEKGDYDWAHLAMAYWPERVREKCKTDKSLAIAHGLEALYVEPEAAPKKTRGRKKTGEVNE